MAWFWPKIGHFGPQMAHKMAQIWVYRTFVTYLCQDRCSFRKMPFIAVWKMLWKDKGCAVFSYDHPYDSSLPTLRQILKFLKWRFFALFGLSTNWSFETLGVASVRAYVRPYVRTSMRDTFSQKPLIRFFWNYLFIFSKSKKNISGEENPLWTPLWLPSPHT